PPPSASITFSSQQPTIADNPLGTAVHGISPTMALEAATGALSPTSDVAESEMRTLVQPAGGTQNAESDGEPFHIQNGGESDAVARSNSGAIPSTIAQGASELTRVGSVLGTPLYMSPEQCRGERLDARSDVYGLGVIAYQMLSGSTPFTGDFTEVMHAHRELAPPPLENKKVRKKLSGVIGAALAKRADDRPQTAQAFSSLLRARSEGIGELLRRAGIIYTSHMPKFLMLATFFFLPTVLFTLGTVILSFLRASELISAGWANALIAADTVLLTVISAFCAYLILGTITWLVAQNMAMPLRPIRVRPALREAASKWKTFAGTGLISIFLTFLIGILTCGIGFLVLSIVWMLLAPVVMMENLKGRAALRRSKDLVRRSLATSIAAFCIMFMIPLVSAGIMTFVFETTARAFDVRPSQSTTEMSENAAGADASNANLEVTNNASRGERQNDININIGRNPRVRINEKDKDMRTRIQDTIFESLLQIFLIPLQIVITSFSAIIVALLYLKTRQAGGEPVRDLLEKFEETELPRKKWQERVRQRLIQSGRITSKP
ncbi:MAG: hypothetical protein LC730_05245, partial [Acidobacteria bacterium]|nr:hypothetical protein [Acidobacteriota bacterium]